jgi:hypothetical protein
MSFEQRQIVLQLAEVPACKLAADARPIRYCTNNV